MTTPTNAKTLQFVVKISKYCNLRCTYCYEYRELVTNNACPWISCGASSNNVAEYASSNHLDSVNFICMEVSRSDTLRLFGRSVCA